jgi:hypothetical protein
MGRDIHLSQQAEHLVLLLGGDFFGRHGHRDRLNLCSRMNA